MTCQRNKIMQLKNIVSKNDGESLTDDLKKSENMITGTQHGI